MSISFDRQYFIPGDGKYACLWFNPDNCFPRKIPKSRQNKMCLRKIKTRQGKRLFPPAFQPHSRMDMSAHIHLSLDFFVGWFVGK